MTDTGKDDTRTSDAGTSDAGTGDAGTSGTPPGGTPPGGATTRAVDPACLFCKIVSGDLPADVVRQDAATVAFRDLEPQAPTHVLVIPRHHVADVGGLAHERPDDAVALLDAVRDVAEQEGLADRGYRSVFNTGAEAHQTVFHAHVHVLGGRSMTWPPG
jgi:histidine triad (HIT) family protein